MRRSLMIAAALAAATTASVQAQTVVPELPREGKFDITNCWAGEQTVIMIHALERHWAFGATYRGIARANGDATVFDGMAFECVSHGEWRNNVLDNERGHCFYTYDNRRDPFVTEFSITKGKGTLRLIASSLGQFHTISGGGEIAVDRPYPTLGNMRYIQGCNRAWGSYKLDP